MTREDFMAHEHWMRMALTEARDAAERGEVPVGAIMVRDGQVIGRGSNKVEQLKDPTAHAEILALGAGAGTLASWRLTEATLYVTLEPCTMCTGAILLARLGQLVFGAVDPRAGAVVSGARLLEGNPYGHQMEVIGGVLGPECGSILKEFFARRRSSTP